MRRAGPRRSWRRRFAWATAKWSAVGGIWGGFAALLFLGWCAYDLPDVSSLNDIKRQPSITLIAADTTQRSLADAFKVKEPRSGFAEVLAGTAELREAVER